VLSHSRARGAAVAIDPKTSPPWTRAETDLSQRAKVLEGEYDRLRPRLDPELARRVDETVTRAVRSSASRARWPPTT